MGDGEGLGGPTRFAYSTSDSNLDVDVPRVVAADAVRLRRSHLQKPQGVVEFVSGLKSPARHPAAVSHHEPVRADGPAHDAFGKHRR
jgi:hypothetical protein